MHRKLRAAGVEAVLQVWEGQSHTQYMVDITDRRRKNITMKSALF
jgi:acetyl esterase/lipase